MTRNSAMQFLRSCLRFLTATETPLWFVIVGVLGSAFGTYLLAPKINREFEKQKVRTEFVIRNLDALNSRTQELVSEISVMNLKISEREKATENRDKAVRLITELQWKSVELSVILSDAESQRILLDYQTALEDSREALAKVDSPHTALIALEKIRAFAIKSLSVTKRIAELSDIRF